MMNTRTNDAEIDVTVVITAYKLEAYLPECLEGLLKQTHKAFDVLILDDASPDNTLDIAMEYQARAPEVFKVTALENNTGLAARVRNLALESGELRGEYVLFLDGDDAIEPDLIEKLLRAARENRADIAICAFDRLETISGRVTKPELSWLNGREPSPDAGDLAFINTSLWNKLIRKDIIADTRVPEIRVGEDALFLMALYEKCERFAFVPEPLLHYRVHALSAISRTNMRDIEQFGAEFARLSARPHSRVISETIAVSAVIHIGLSMAMRAAQNPEVNILRFTKWACALFRASFNNFKGVKLLSARSLLKRGGLGAAIWLSKRAYKLRAAPIALYIARRFSRAVNTRARW